MKSFLILITILFSITASITSCTDKEVPSPGTLQNGAQHVHDNVRDDEPVLIRGHVRNTNGVGIASASVQLFAAGQITATYSTTTGTDGSYSISNIIPGGYTIVLSASGYQSKSVGMNLRVDTVYSDTLLLQ